MKVSVVIPCFNAESTIQATIDSVLPQLTESDELIIVNDASTDNTINVLKQIMLNTLIRVYFSEMNYGVAKSIKKGFDIARNNIVAIIDSDSIAPPDWINTIKSNYTEHTIMVCGSYRSINDPTRNAYLDWVSKYTKNPNGSGTNMSINKKLALETGLMNNLPKYSWDKTIQERAFKTNYARIFINKPVLTHTPTNLAAITKQSFRYGKGRASRKNITIQFILQRLLEITLMPIFNWFFITQPILFKALWMEYYRIIIHTGGLMYGIFSRV